MTDKTYKRGELMEVIVDGYAHTVLGFKGKRVVTPSGKYRYADIQKWRLPWGHTFQPNLHMILPLCNKGSQRIW